ncbi:MAG: hypothetical protein F6J86_17345 [Symploca sp. SIO1B1]|nr:hypothetical protein [Symploca sp. SIO1B1]
MSNQKEPILKYQVGGTLAANAPTYVERQADKDLFEALKNQKLCYVMSSRQMGQSSLRARTIQRLTAQGVACVDIQATEIIQQEGLTPEKWYLGVIDQIIAQLQLNCDHMQWWEQHENFSEVVRFKQFISEILLEEIQNKEIVIFFDEIDALLSLDFSLSDFFSVISECLNSRANKKQFNKLTFVLIGVATPTDLIKDSYSTPFNTGTAIELTSFKFAEAQQLSQGLIDKVDHPEQVVQIILNWTGGQPFLTQKICKMIQGAEVPKTNHNLEEWIEQLIRTKIINNWEYQDSHEHLKTIERTIVNNFAIQELLQIYQQIIELGELPFDNSRWQMKLRLSGLLVNRQGKLVIHNKIYQEIFNQEWLHEQLKQVITRPYQIQIEAWISSNCQDQSKLLFGEELKKAQIWAKDLLLTRDDERFIYESNKFEQEIRALLPSIDNRESVIDTVMSLTEGNKNLNKSIFILLSQEKKRYGGLTENWVKTIVRSRIIENWQTEAHAEPLREISRSLLENSLCDPFWLLIAYRQLLLTEELDREKERGELKKIAIVVEKDKQLAVANPIYANVFNVLWTNHNLGKLRPYAKKLVAWIDSEGQDRYQLLSAKQLQEAQKFLVGKKLDPRENRFLVDSMLKNT